MRGVFIDNPPRPRYISTWDVSLVLDFLKKLEPLRELSLKLLTYKLVALLALSTAARAQTLISLSIDSFKENDNSVIFSCGDRLKNSKPGVDFNLHIRKYSDKTLCPVRTLKYYLRKTSKRKDRQLLVSYVTLKAVSTSTVARWLKTVLRLAGIDIETFKAHSFRGASASAAFSAGCSMKNILEIANWNSAKNFKKFYLREVPTSNTCVNYSNMFVTSMFTK